MLNLSKVVLNSKQPLILFLNAKFMKQLTFIIFLFSFLGFSNNTKKIIVAFSLNDCANCSVILNQLNDVLENPEMTFVFKSELEPDSLLVYKQTGVNNFNSIIKFSDELYNKYTSGIRSTINIVDNDKIVYSSLLLKVEIDSFLKIYNSANKKICFDNIKNGVQFIQDDHSLVVYSSQLKRWSYYDRNNSFDVIADESWVEKAYKLYYKDKGEAVEKLNDYKIVAKESPNILPEATKCIKTNTNELVFFTEIAFLQKDYEKKNIDIKKKSFLITYGIKEQTINSIKYINSEDKVLNEKYTINAYGFHTVDNEYIIPLKPYDVTKENKYLSVFIVNPDNPNELVLKEILDKNIPNNYIKYKLNRNFHNYCFDKSLVLLGYGEFIYDYKKDVSYKIPFPESEFETLKNVVANVLETGKTSSYYIRDIFDKGETILLLYKDSSKNLKLMELDKKTEKAQDKVLLTVDKLENYNNSSSFSFNKNGEVHYLNNDNCIVKL